MRARPDRLDYDVCAARWFQLPHKYVTFYWDKFGTGEKDATIEACKFCRKLKP